jgi:hypothetical protein
MTPASITPPRPNNRSGPAGSGLVLLILGTAALLAAARGCSQKDASYGVEKQLVLQAPPQTWAVAPVENLSGQKGIDPLLQADLVYAQMQQVYGLTVIPVDRVVEVYTALHIEKVQTPEQASAVCDALDCDGLVVPTVTLFDPYDPPKLGATLQLFRHRRRTDAGEIDPTDLARRAAPPAQVVPGLNPPAGGFLQSVGEFDASNGSVLQAVNQYAAGRSDPVGPMGARAYTADMDRFCSFGYHSLLRVLLKEVETPHGGGAANDKPVSAPQPQQASQGRPHYRGGSPAYGQTPGGATPGATPVAMSQ